MRIAIVILALCAAAYAQQCVPVPDRVDCHPDPDASEENCLARGCQWCTGDEGTPWCHVPANYGYKMVGTPEETPNGYRVTLSRSTNASYFGNDAETLTATFEVQSDYRLRIKITDGTDRFEVPLKINPPASEPASPLFSIEFTNDPVFSFKVIRQSTGTVVFDTSLGGLTFSDQFIQLGIKIPSTNAYGIGENEQPSYRHDFSKFTPVPLFARDQSPTGYKNSYGVHPYYTVIENDGNAHSVVIVNSNAQEFVIQPTPGYVYRTIGGLLDIYVFLGPTVEETVQQFTEAIGRQSIPPYFGLGFQLCRWGYDSIETMQATVNRTAAAGIPQDIQYGDIDIMQSELDFTYDPTRFHDLPAYVTELKSKGIKFIPIVDPFIKYDEPRGTYPALDLGDQMDVWMKRSSGEPWIGNCWPGQVYYPDYSRNSTKQWWAILLREYKNLIDYDGIWIDMNEPANWGKGDVVVGCENNKYNNPPYVPAIETRDLVDNTACMDVEQDFGIHYDTHSLYGWSESEPTTTAVRDILGKRSIVVSRSTFLGSGNWVAHWLGDNMSTWSNMKASIIALLHFNLFGMPYAGSDICGFGMNSNEEMCTRWQQLGAFYPYSRNHNALGNIEQDPAVWGPESRESTRRALLIRYTLIPYLYTLFFHHKTKGSTVVRALFHEFTKDPVTHGIDEQMMWGSGFLISPVLREGHDSVTAYFPDARWYSYYDGAEVNVRGAYTNLDAPFGFINLHVRGGNILPTQEPAMNTDASRQNPFGLIIALDDESLAEGTLYYDDGNSIEPQDSGLYFLTSYTYNNGTLRNQVERNEFSEMSQKVLNTIRLMGVDREVTGMTVNGNAHTDFTQLPSGEVQVNNLNLTMVTPFTITFQ
ncbi:unnamed protein product [Orchesella dallaii]|uniref:P-type domain-containing protein n=1 Tax=Orchesella dallaii TaxID=48710 RepID=A0ABP1Q2M0_9HEXA